MTLPQSELDRIRGYLVAQANKLSIPDLVEKVRADVAPLRAAADVVPAARFTDRPAEGEWSGAEVWTHIVQMNEHGATAITGILDEGRLPEPASDIISGETLEGLQTGREYYEAFLERREQLLARVSAATGGEPLDVKIDHAMFGSLNWREWLLFMRVHDLDHLRQLQSVAAALEK